MPGAPAAAMAAPLSVEALAARSGLEIPPDGLEFCGIGRVTAAQFRRWKADPALAAAEIGRYNAELNRQMDAMLTRVAGRLSAGNEREQVAARLLMDDPEGAAALAVGSGDPMTYRLAMRGCAPGTAREAAPGCARLSAQRWAALDPTDARPWLVLMAQAHERGDGAAVDAALAEAAARPRLSGNSFVLEAQVARALAPETDPALRAALAVRLVGMDTVAFEEVGTLYRVCREPARQAVCGTVARQVLAAADTLMEASVSQSMIERLGVPKDQQAHDGARLRAASKAYVDFSRNAVGFDCAAMSAMAALSNRRVQQGELGLALSLLPPHAR